MWENMKFKSSNSSGSVAAAYLIFSVGLVGCTVCTGLLFWQNPEVPVAVLSIGGLLALVTILLRLRPELPSDCLWLFSRSRRPAEADYTPTLIKSHPSTFGTNRPPTVEEIRELKDTPRNWVPSRSRSGRASLR